MLRTVRDAARDVMTGLTGTDVFEPGRVDPANGELIDLAWVLDRLRQRWWIYPVCLGVLLALALLLTRDPTPTYRAMTRIQFDDGGQTIDLQALMNQRYSDLPPIQNEIQRLTSPMLVERVVEALDLTRFPEFNELAPPPSGDPDDAGWWIGDILFGDRPTEADGAAGGLSDEAADAASVDYLAAEDRARRTTAEAVLEALLIRPIEDSRVVEIEVSSEDATLAARIANEFVTQYGAIELEDQLRNTQAATDLLARRAESLSVEAGDAADAVVRKRGEIAIRYGASPEVTQQQVVATTAALTTARNERLALTSEVAQLEEMFGASQDFSTIPALRNSPGAGAEIAQRDDLVAERNALLQVYAPRNEAVRRIDAQIAEKDRRIEAEASNYLNARRNALAAAEAREASLGDSLSALEETVRAQAAEQTDLRNLEYKADASRAIYEGILERMNQVADRQELGRPAVRVLAFAEPPLEPEPSLRLLAVIAAVLLGVGLGTAVIVLLEALRRGFLTSADIDRRIGLPLLACVPTESGLRRGRIPQFVTASTSAFVEAFRILRGEITSGPSDGPKILLVTSSLPGEGKSTVAMMLAQALVSSGRRAVLVDCDLRYSRPREPEVFAPEVETEDVWLNIHGTDVVGESEHVQDVEVVSFRTRTSDTAVPPDLVASPEFAAFVGAFAESYEFVILDSPPTMVFGDARNLAGLAHSILYVVRWRTTRVDAVIQGIRGLRVERGRFAGVVLNKVNPRALARIQPHSQLPTQIRYADYYDSMRRAQ